MYLIYSKAGSTGIIYLVMMILAANQYNKNVTADYIYIQSIVGLINFIALNGHSQDIYRSFHSKNYFLSINLLRRYTLIFFNSIILNIGLYIFFYLTKSEFTEYIYYIFIWQLISAILLLNFEYFVIKKSGIYAYIFSNTTINLIVATFILAILYNSSTLDIEKIIKINFYSALGIGILFIVATIILGIQRIRFKNIHKYYIKNIYIAGISMFSIGLYNIDLIFIKIGYNQDVYSSYALGSKFASILLMINSFAYSMAPKLIKNKNPIYAFSVLKKLKNKLIFINIFVILLIAVYILSIYEFTDDILIIFIIFAMANLINIGFGIRLPLFILLKKESLIFNIAKYIFTITILIYFFIVISSIDITMTALLLSSIIVIQSYIEASRLKRLLNV